MQFTLVVSAAPEPALQPAQFAAALIAEGHSLNRVFFLREGVRHAEAGSAAAAAWLALPGAGQRFELAVCIGAAERRHVTPAFTHDAVQPQLEPGVDGVQRSPSARFEVVGLGQLVDALVLADRVVDFPG